MKHSIQVKKEYKSFEWQKQCFALFLQKKLKIHF